MREVIEKEEKQEERVEAGGRVEDVLEFFEGDIGIVLEAKTRHRQQTNTKKVVKIHRFILLAPSGALVVIMVYYIPVAQATHFFSLMFTFIKVVPSVTHQSPIANLKKRKIFMELL